MNRIDLPNRYNEVNYLEQISEKEYKLVLADDYYRVLPHPDIVDEFSAVDPSGGPMLYVGDKLPGTELVIKRIKDDLIFEVE